MKLSTFPISIASALLIVSCKTTDSTEQEPPPPTDQEITDDVVGKLMADPVTMHLPAVWDKGVSTQNGTVSLTGVVPREAFKAQCEKVAQGGYGVKSVINKISVNGDLDGAIRFESKFGTDR